MRTGRIEIGVLADDLTGALASAARLRARGLLPAIHWRVDSGPPETDAVVVDMRTRDRGVEPLAQARHWAARLRELGCRRFELRTDSTFRGNPAAELDGLIQGAGFADPLVLAVPAFPDADRITIGGRQLVRDGTEYDVTRLLFGDRPVRIIGRPEVEAGPRAVAAAIEAAAGRGARCFVADADADRHLIILAAAATALEAGKAELVTASPGAWLRWYPAAVAVPGDFVLVVLSSVTSQNLEQLAVLRQGTPPVVVTGPDKPILPDADRATLVVQTVDEDDPPHRETERSDRVARFAPRAAAAARACLELADRDGRHCRGIVVSGGATASHLMDALGAEHLWAGREVAPLCAMGTLLGGCWSGLRIITKGGMVGQPETMSRLVEALWSED